MASEFTLIDAFLSRFDAPGRGVVLGAGDDCAVLPPSKEPLCVTTDAVVEDVHFRLPAFSLEDVGHKALAVNLSDLAAMGATPRWFVCALGLPRTFGMREVRRLGAGMSALARRHGIALVGGNITQASVLSVTLTAAGSCRRPLTRAGARPGDLLYVSGTLGDARLGVSILVPPGSSPRAGPRSSRAQSRDEPLPLSEVPSHARAFLARRQKRPTPRIALGLIARRFATATIDLSDGLGQDLGHLCRASGVGARVEWASLPVSPALVRSVGSREAAWRAAAAGGEDYELLLAVPPRRAKAFEEAARGAGERVRRIGGLTSEQAVCFVDPTGRASPPPAGHDHFG